MKVVDNKWTNRIISPVTVTGVIALVLTLTTIFWVGEGDVLYLARLGTRFLEGDPQGSEGYDGQFVYYIALNPSPEEAAIFLDVPAYRYQRILYPLLSRTLCFGMAECIPWAMVFLNVIALIVGTYFVVRLLNIWRVNHWYSLIYGVWAGFTLSLVVDLPEPLAYGLVCGALFAREKYSYYLSAVLFGLSLFAKEVTILFLFAVILEDVFQKRKRNVLFYIMFGLLPFLMFQAWLWVKFGQIGLGSGGAMATGFEFIPFMGLLRIAEYSWVYFLAMLFVFGPTILFPAIWGTVRAVKQGIEGKINTYNAALLFNGLLIFFLPFSTFRETGGLIRLASGLILSLLLFCSYNRKHKALNLLLFLWVLNVFLVKS